jgi:hypothetical protein
MTASLFTLRMVEQFLLRGYGIIIAFAGLLAIYLLTVNVILVLQPYPLEYREGAILMSTAKFASGGNPFSWENQPTYLNVYGILHSVLLAPVCVLLPGEIAEVHRTASMLLMLGACALVTWILVRRGASPILAIGAGLVYYGQLLHTFLPVARPDSLGLFLFLVSVLGPIASNFSLASLVVSAVTALLAWITKPYFALGGVVIGLYTLLAVDWKAGLLYCTSSALAAAGIGIFLNRFFEAYFYDVLLVNAGSGLSHSLPHLGFQVVKFLVINAPLITLCVVLILSSRKFRPHPVAFDRTVAMPSAASDQGLVPVLRHLDPVTFQLLVSGGALYVLAQNVGSAEYFFHLLTPFFLIKAVMFVGRKSFPFLALFVLLCQASVYAPRFPKDYSSQWADLTMRLSAETTILSGPPTVKFALDNGRSIYDSGQTEYFQFGLKYDSALASAAKARWKTFTASLRQQLREASFSLVVTTVDAPSLVDRQLIGICYQRQETIPAPMYYSRSIALELWRPNPGGCDNPPSDSSDSGQIN